MYRRTKKYTLTRTLRPRAELSAGTRLLIGAIALTALAFTPTGSDPTCVAVEFTLHAYSGQIHVTDACLTSFTHAGDSMVIEARDMGDGIFKSGFEIWP